MFLVVPDESEFGQRVPLVIGTCTIGQIINVIQESEIDHLSMPWTTARMVQLVSCQKSTAVPCSGECREGASRGPQQVDVDELVMVKECPFRTIPDRDHRGKGQTPPWRHGPHYGHTAEGGRRSTEGLQTTSSGTPCPTHVYTP